MSALEQGRAALVAIQSNESYGDGGIDNGVLVSIEAALEALIEEIDSRDEYAAIFDAPQGAWREPLGALRLTLTGDPESVDVRRAQIECEQLVKVLNGVKE